MRSSTLLLVFSLATLQAVHAAPLQVSAVSPRANGLTAIHTPISVTFDRAVNLATVNAATFRVHGRWSGPVQGSFALSNAGSTLTFTPSRTFFPGEIVHVNLATAILALDGEALRTGGYAFSFHTAAQPATRSFLEIDSFSNRTSPGIPTRIYGAAGADLNADGWPDLTTVNEISADLRVYLNLADGTGLFTEDFLGPFAIGEEASPNEPGDFDNDGKVDMAVAASDSNSAWISLGNGDGTFATAQSVPVGTSPHGLALLDVDGDADLDIVTANSVGNNLSLMRNDGNGVFGAAIHFESGGNGEYGLAAGDMNGDGIADLVVGTQTDQRIRVLTGTGTGTFTPLSVRQSGGLVWMVTVGDVNADGDLDVTSANGGSGNGAVLLGNGDGTLQPATTVSVGSGVVGTDLGDLDGDGDLDWILSSFGSSLWKIFVNDGFGSFTLDQQIDAPSNASCSVLIDFDGDRDLDMALIDEVADLVLLQKNENGPAALPGAVPASPAAPLQPLRIGKGSPGMLDLTWSPSCRVTDTDYAVYAGPIGSFTDHDLVTCATGGLTAATITPDAGDLYYLVVPLNAGFEGSYGTTSSGAQRPPASPACHPQSLPVPVCL
jgi:hypothetical protein